MTGINHFRSFKKKSSPRSKRQAREQSLKLLSRFAYSFRRRCKLSNKRTTMRLSGSKLSSMRFQEYRKMQKGSNNRKWQLSKRNSTMKLKGSSSRSRVSYLQHLDLNHNRNQCRREKKSIGQPTRGDLITRLHSTEQIGILKTEKYLFLTPCTTIVNCKILEISATTATSIIELVFQLKNLPRKRSMAVPITKALPGSHLEQVEIISVVLRPITPSNYRVLRLKEANFMSKAIRAGAKVTKRGKKARRKQKIALSMAASLTTNTTRLQ